MPKLISIRIADRLLQLVDEAGAAEGRGRSDIFREAVEAWIHQRRLAEMVRRHVAGYATHPVAVDEFEPVVGAQVLPH